MAITITVSPRDVLAKIHKELEKLKPTPARRFALARKTAKLVKQYSGKRASAQQSLEGGSFAPRSQRSRQRKKKRLLREIGKAQNMAEYRREDGCIVTFKRGRAQHMAIIAAKHHMGASGTLHNTDKMRAGLKKLHVKQKNTFCTYRMAKALLRNGYRMPVRGKNGKIRLKRVSAAYLQQNMKQNHAAWLLRLLVRNDVSHDSPSNQKPQSWEYVLPARPFLGVTNEQASALLAFVSKEVLAGLKK